MADNAKVAVVTGGAGNVGTETVKILAENSWQVFVPWRKKNSWDELMEEMSHSGLQDSCTGIEADLTVEGDVEKLMHQAAEAAEGKIRALVNLVGMFKFGTEVRDTPLSEWNMVMDVNLKSVFLCCKHAVPAMQQNGGYIINTTSKAAIDLQPGAAAYAVAKSGIITLTEILREELKYSDVQTNAIMPGIIDTPVTRRLMPNGNPEKWVKPQQIAQKILHICEGYFDGIDGSVLRMFGDM